VTGVKIIIYTKIDLPKPKISFKPTRQTIFTLTKAPMAHKTFSQEQFLFKFYKFTIRFSVPMPLYLTLNQSLYILLFLRQSLPIVETNILFLKRFNLRLVNADAVFMTSLLRLDK
jgi:hypothetical protein